MICSILQSRCTACSCEKSHWSVKVYATMGLVSTVAFAILLTVALRQRFGLLPYAIASGCVAITALPAAFLINKYYILKQLDDVSNAIGDTADDLDAVADAIDQESDDLRATIIRLQAAIEERSKKVSELTAKLEKVEDELSETENDLTRTFEQSRADMQKVIQLLNEDDDFKEEAARLQQVQSVTAQFKAMLTVVSKAMDKLKALVDLAETSKEVDDTWDQNRAELDKSSAHMQGAAAKLKEVEAKLQEVLAQARYIKVGRLLEKEQPALFGELLARSV